MRVLGSSENSWSVLRKSYNFWNIPIQLQLYKIYFLLRVFREYFLKNHLLEHLQLYLEETNGNGEEE